MVGGAAAFFSLGAGTGAYMAMRAYGVGPPGTLLGAGTLVRGDRLIVAEFENATDDPLLAGAVAGALRIDLGQSRAIRVVDPVEVSGAVERVGLERGAFLNAELARRIAVREGAKAVVAGEVSTAGTAYQLGTATGKLPAVMTATTPTGSRKVNSCLSGISDGTVCP